MVKEIAFIIIRFVFTLFLFTVASIHLLVFAVPDAGRPAVILTSLLSSFFIAMYDIGVFRVDIDSDYIDFR